MKNDEIYSKEEVLFVLGTFEKLLFMNCNDRRPPATVTWAESYKRGIKLMHKLLEVKCKCQK